jgi:hypothetical protein
MIKAGKFWAGIWAAGFLVLNLPAQNLPANPPQSPSGNLRK